MIEGALVHILSATAPHAFIGCGAVIEGGLIATCRHVWRDAVLGADKGALPFADFPRADADRRQTLTLADACDQETRPPDLVLLRPRELPSGTPVLQLAMHDLLETGSAACRARLRRSGPQWAEVTIRGTLDPALDPEGRRQFSGQAPNGYWFARGSSGSPLFKDGGQQLAAILSLSELGADEDGSGRHEAFVIPGTLIRRYAIRLAAAPVAQAEGIDPADLANILRDLGTADAPVREIPARLRDYIAVARAQGAAPVVPSNEGADIDAAIGAARDKVQRLDAAGARAVLEAKLAQEEEAQRRRVVPLLREKLSIERLACDHGAAKATLRSIIALDGGQVWDWIALGDLHRDTGAAMLAREAFAHALDAARRIDPVGRDVLVASNRLGDVLLRQGQATAALDEYRKAMAIAERLVARDAGEAKWQWDLWASHNKVADVLEDQGDTTAALAEYGKALIIAARLAASDPGQADWQRDLSVSHLRIGSVLHRRGEALGAQLHYRKGMVIREHLAAINPGRVEWQYDLSLNYTRLGDVLVIRGETAAALAEYSKAIAIAARLVTTDSEHTEWQRHLGYNYIRVGDVLRTQSDASAALAEYRKAMAIAEWLVAIDPSTSLWQDDLSIAHNKVGLVLTDTGHPRAALAEYRKGMAIAKRLAATDPLQPEWQRSLMVSHQRIGDALQEQRDTAAALAEYRKSMAIAERLVATDPSNAEWQRDLAISYQRIGATLWRQGNAVAALAECRKGMEITERLAASDPGHAEWQRDLIVGLDRLARTDPPAARAHLTRALAIARALADTGRLAPVDAWLIPEFERRLAALP
ncbi:tetratricopeptide repeat protein [Roseomonas fluvialis]|uniref:Tetratricopeptide repeat protein n=1 Tax=Roseomonas fluvialis TaxID=1750527 RepID=A0ABN6P3M9_9PROT|nr:tetratricopeptide repeat protein [Roseomonas fluvialis]BDG73246.1 hypothetical protein Rmf_31750 [Roseomonas fluvialis]